jgi:hypothetical protein
MSRTKGLRRIVPAIGALVTTMAAALAIAPAALAIPHATVSPFTYASSDATKHTLSVTATNTGSNPLDVFDLLVMQSTKLSNVTLTVGTTQYPKVCTAINGGFPVVQCTPPATLMTKGATWTITFKTSTVYPAGSTSMWFADDKTGANNGALTGP